MWQERARFCPLCGAGLELCPQGGRERPTCTSCGFILYFGPAGAAAAVVIEQARGTGPAKVLLVRRGIEPHKGAWAFPAGYQEIDEHPMRALAREVLEETGVEIEVDRLVDLLFIPDDPRKPANVAVYLCHPVREGVMPHAGDDARDARWFSLDALPEELGFANNRAILDAIRREAAYPVAPPSLGDSPQMSVKPISYKDAGVDIAAQDEALARSKEAIRGSFTPGVLGDVGAFGGLFDPAKMGFGEGSILVSSADGVGTKLEVAKRAGIHDTVGRDLVNHCINDILVQGATPLFFMDYVGTGRLDPVVVSDLIRGCAEACSAAGMALLGGETAEMPGLYAEGDFDLVGFIVGAVKRDRLIDGSRVAPGQVLIGLPSAGLHTNGYSLARAIVFDRLGLALGDQPELLGGASVQEALLAEHKCYARVMAPLLDEGLVCGMAHITGGGLPGNVNRMLTDTDAHIDTSSWQVPGLFQLLVEGGALERSEAFKALNMGVGLVMAVNPSDLDRVLSLLVEGGEAPWRIGELVPGQGVVHLSE